MSMPRKRMFFCDKCEREFETEVYESINVTLNPELKEKILSGDIYVFECPFCHEKHFAPYPFLYNDMEHQFMIQQGSPASLLTCDDELKNGNSGDFKNVFGNLLEGYKRLGATSFGDFRSKIIMLENDLDYRIGTIYEFILMQEFNHYLEEKKDTSVRTVGAFFNYDNEGELCVNIEVEETTEPYKHKSIDVPFEKGLYDTLEKDFRESVNDVYNYYFDFGSAAKILFTDPEKIEEYKNTDVELAIVELVDGDQFIGLIPPFNKGKYNVDDAVIIMKEKLIAKGNIKAFHHMSRYALPTDLDDLPAVAWKVRDIELITTKDSNEILNNSCLKEDLISHKEDFKFNHNDLAAADVIATFKVELNKSFNIDPETLKVGDTLPSDSLNMRFAGTIIDNQEYLNVYLDQSDCKDETVSRGIYNFESLVDFVFNKPERFSGILINPGENQIVLRTSLLLQHRQNLIMCDHSKMEHILENLRSEEINYLSKFSYENMCEVYFKGLTPKQISENTGKSIGEIKTALDNGYSLLKHIIWDNYQFDI